VVPIKQNVFCGPVKLFINVGPKFELPETVKDEDVKLFDIVVIPETFNDDKHVVLFNVVKPEILSEDKHETLLLNVVNPVTYNKVLILTPYGLILIDSHAPLLVFKIILLISPTPNVKSPIPL